MILKMLNLPTYVLAGNVVATCGDKVLLVKRGCEPERGKWAFPGGHIEPREGLMEGSFRELKEETGLDASRGVLKGVQFAPFGGHMIFYYVVQFSGDLPEVRGADDAEEARWIPIAEAMEEGLAFDHAAILGQIISGDLWAAPEWATMINEE